ncbi:hypothetical protein CARUB_v10002311mg [Capsella rubella]|uniref:Uncharacterized protein n=2 Tax=Capsella rubella TaxID=81985 RepID=R0GY69_9BRAS|nr:hypothetical protein CARUB_v10002311mg [Capsella rubella]
MDKTCVAVSASNIETAAKLSAAFLFWSDETRRESEMNPQTDKVVRRTTMVATVVASYFLLTGDYGPEPNVLDPIKRIILSAQDSVKQFIFGPKKEPSGKEQSDNAK